MLSSDLGEGIPHPSHSIRYPTTEFSYLRICPGQMFADASVWLAAANMIAALDLSFAKNALGRDIIPDAAFISGFVR